MDQDCPVVKRRSLCGPHAAPRAPAVASRAGYIMQKSANTASFCIIHQGYKPRLLCTGAGETLMQNLMFLDKTKRAC